MHEIAVPKLNSNDRAYVLVEWLAADGDELAAGSPVAVIETSKTAEELVAGCDGVLQQELEVNAECGIGAVIGRLFPSRQARADYLAAQQAERSAADIPLTGGLSDQAAGDVVITKSAREAAAEFGIDLAALRSLGKKVLRRRDVEELAAAAGQDARGTIVRLPAAQQSVGRVVTRSHQDIPAAFVVIKVPADAALGQQADLAERSQLAIGFPELLIKAVAGLRDRFPLFFGYYREDGTVSVVPGAHVGVTLDLGKGLFVPVIRHAEEKQLTEITGILLDFRISALRGSFREKELSGGNITISLSNDPGVVLARPIIFPGQTCMLCLCAVQQELCLTDTGDVGTRNYLNLGITYDHRVINGRDAITFGQELNRLLGEPGKLSGPAGELLPNEK